MLAALVTAAGLVASSGNAPFYWQGHVPAGQSIEIKNTYGSIHAEPALGDKAEVVAHRAGHPEEVVDLKIGVTESQDGVTIRAMDPAGVDDVQIDFTVRVPKGVRFVGRTVNGSVEAEKLTGDAAAYTVNGDVRMSAAGSTQAQTVNGSITAVMGSTHAGKNLRFTSVNGGITLQVPRRLNAHLRATTVHGGIQSDFRLCLENKAAGRKASGVLGRGGPELTLTTINGSINLRQNTRL